MTLSTPPQSGATQLKYERRKSLRVSGYVLKLWSSNLLMSGATFVFTD